MSPPPECHINHAAERIYDTRFTQYHLTLYIMLYIIIYQKSTFVNLFQRFQGNLYKKAKNLPFIFHNIVKSIQILIWVFMIHDTMYSSRAAVNKLGGSPGPHR